MGKANGKLERKKKKMPNLKAGITAEHLLTCRPVHCYLRGGGGFSLSFLTGELVRDAQGERKMTKGVLNQNNQTFSIGFSAGPPVRSSSFF